MDAWLAYKARNQVIRFTSLGALLAANTSWHNNCPSTDVTKHTHTHAPCQGSDTKETGFYPRKLAEIFLDGVFPSNEMGTACVVYPELGPEQHETMEEISHLAEQLVLDKPEAENLQIMQDLNRQINKAVARAKAKLEKKTTKTRENGSKRGSVVNALPVYVSQHEIEEILIPQQVAENHRKKLCSMPLGIMGAVVKVLKPGDPLWRSKGAAEALLKEATKLMKAGVWDLEPEEKSEVIKKHPDASFSRLFEILGLKNSESETPIFKARVVVQGSNVTDSSGDAVYFADTASAPTNMCAIRSLVAYGELSGGGSSSSDAEAAYIQPLLPDDVVLYVVVPPSLQTPEMIEKCSKLRNPVFRLRRPLYGWSRSGNIWEKHLAETLQSLDEATERQLEHVLNKLQNTTKWKPVENWPQTFWKRNKHDEIVMLTVYVDDFVMSGPHHDEEWPAIRKAVTMTDPEPVGRVLGVHYNFDKAKDGTRKVTMDMKNYTQQALDMYHSIKDAPPLRNGVHYPWYEPTMAEIQQLSSLPGAFSGHAASLLMKLLYMARMVRLDICYAINQLSRFVTKWNKLCDKQLCHLFSYLKQTEGSSLHAVVDPSDLDSVELHAYPDADLAGSYDSTKATSGGFLEVHGNNTFHPLDWFSKRQTATAHSTTEAELIAASKMLRESLVPLMDLWSIMLDRPVRGVIHEDNQSTITIIESGYSPQMRHLAKHHRTSLGIVHEMTSQPDIELKHVTTDKQKGDLLTKGLARPKHDPACKMVGLYPFIVVCEDTSLSQLPVVAPGGS